MSGFFLGFFVGFFFSVKNQEKLVISLNHPLIINLSPKVTVLAHTLEARHCTEYIFVCILVPHRRSVHLGESCRVVIKLL